MTPTLSYDSRFAIEYSDFDFQVIDQNAYIPEIKSSFAGFKQVSRGLGYHFLTKLKVPCGKNVKTKRARMSLPKPEEVDGASSSSNMFARSN